MGEDWVGGDDWRKLWVREGLIGLGEGLRARENLEVGKGEDGVGSGQGEAISGGIGDLRLAAVSPLGAES